METGAWQHSQSDRTGQAKPSEGQTEPLPGRACSRVGSERDNAPDWVQTILHTCLKMHTLLDSHETMMPFTTTAVRRAVMVASASGHIMSKAN